MIYGSKYNRKKYIFKLGFKYLKPSQQTPEDETILLHSKELRADMCVKQVVKLEVPVI